MGGNEGNRYSGGGRNGRTRAGFSVLFWSRESHYPNKPREMTVLKGLKNYIEEVDYEERSARAIPRQDSLYANKYGGASDRKPKTIFFSF